MQFTAQLVVGRDARDKRRRMERSLPVIGRLIIILSILTAALYLKRYLDIKAWVKEARGNSNHVLVPWEGPSKIVSKKFLTHIDFGLGQGDLISEVLLEDANVDHLTIHISAEVSQREKENEGDLPVLQFGVEIFSGVETIWFKVQEDQLEDHALVKLKIGVPPKYSGSLFVSGSFVDIHSSTLENACFWNLNLSTGNGNIILGNMTRTSWLYADVKQHGDIHTGTLVDPYLGRGFQAHVHTNTGDIVVGALTSKYEEGLGNHAASDHAIFAKSQEGNIFLDISEDEGDVFDDNIVSGNLLIEATTRTGTIRGRVEVVDDQEVYLDAESEAGDVTIELSDKYSGKISVSTKAGQTVVGAKAGSKDVITYQRFDREEKRGTKYSTGPAGPSMIGDHVSVLSHNASAKVIFI
ncbi:hypothetical protein BGX26_009866 [Mortierella sp. AD094]|nr:hypothetical protein BGX26_009866 [Mortierella sp. AD094]